jgi:hypothetical protein
MLPNEIQTFQFSEGQWELLVEAPLGFDPVV